MATSAVDILDHHRARGGSITLPQFGSVDSVVGSEIERVPKGCEVVGRTIATSAVDILDHHRTRGGTIALPQFASVGSVFGCEIECSQGL